MSKLDNLGNVLIRSDLNVPIKNGEITDNFRILKSVEILESVLDKSRTIRSTSHMGRPNDKDLNLSLRPVACLLYTSPSPRDLSTSRMPSSA